MVDIHVEKRHLYFFGMFFLVLIGCGLIYSYDGTSPSVMGHSSGEVEIEETDPTVASSVKDGVSWSELSGIPADFADGVAEFKANGIASIGNPLLGVDMDHYEGIWAYADYTLYDPANTSVLPETFEYRYPMFGPVGMQVFSSI